MLILLENSGKDLELLISALTAEGIARKSITAFDDLKKAKRKLTQLDKKKLNAIAIIADLGLGDEHENGADFISQQFHNASEIGGGLWTVLISVVDLGRRDFKFIHPVPHITYNKDNPNWAKICARDIKRLFFSSFEFDNNNDFAPPRELSMSPADRIYYYSDGDAEYLSPIDIDTSGYFTFKRVKPRDWQESNGILMYRGRYIYTSQFKDRVSPKLFRVLLRWRIASLTCARYENRDTIRNVSSRSGVGIKHICSWKKDSDDSEPVLDEEHGFPIRSIINDVGYFRRDPDVRNLDSFLFGDALRKGLDDFPSIKRETIPTAKSGERIALSYDALNAYYLPFLERPGTKLPEDNFLTRIQFVLSQRELDNYTEWKSDWEKYFLNRDSFKA